MLCLDLTADSWIYIDLVAEGVLKALAHNRTLRVRPELLVPLCGEPGEVLELPIEARVAVDAIEPLGEDLSARDRRKLLDNLRGPKVLEASRHPYLLFRGRYQGAAPGDGRLVGNLHVRGEPHPWEVSVTTAREADGTWTARGSREGTLHALGLKPFSALMGAVRLRDWLRIRLELRFVERPA